MRAWFRRFCSLKEYPVPAGVLPIRDNFWSLVGRRVRLLSLSDSQRRVVLFRATDFRAALKVYRSLDPQSAVPARARDAAVGAGVDKRPRYT